MRILYLAVHSHVGWGAEYWMARAMAAEGLEVVPLDYRVVRDAHGLEGLTRQLRKLAAGCDLLFVQRADGLTPAVLASAQLPVVLWSTEPIERNRDIDALLASDVADRVLVHTYSCVTRIEREFPHLLDRSAVMHLAAPRERLRTGGDRPRRAIFNRSLSSKRRVWLAFARPYVDVVRGRYGEAYFDDLAASEVAVNIHVSWNPRVDDVETGVFEALVSGCVVVSERLDPRARRDLEFGDAVLEVSTPWELRSVLRRLTHDPGELESRRAQVAQVAGRHTWDARLREDILPAFHAVC